MQIVSLKLPYGTQENNHFLWDKMYLVREGDTHRIKEMFNYSLVIPLTDVKKNRIERMLKGADSTILSDVIFSRIIGMQRNDLTTNHEAIQEILTLINEFDYGVIPILVTYNKAKKMSQPRYLSGKKHRNSLTSRHYMKQRFPKGTYLQLMDKKINPICMMCKYSINSLSNKCTTGERSCYEGLVFGKSNYFADKKNEGAHQEAGVYTNLDTEVKLPTGENQA